MDLPFNADGTFLDDDDDGQSLGRLSPRSVKSVDLFSTSPAADSGIGSASFESAFNDHDTTLTINGAHLEGFDNDNNNDGDGDDDDDDDDSIGAYFNKLYESLTR